ncbi:MAG: ABC transporter ATP-binding protein [Bacillota bacterium]|nr:ABC transporter ATP-binding protein [Bacillota bacterium]
MISLRNISKCYKGNGINTIALNDISLDIQKSEFVSIMGRSGCGKTTLLNILGCMDSFTSGEYIFEDINVKSLKGKSLAQFRNKKIGFVFQSFNLINEMTILENIEVPLGYAGIPGKKRKQVACELLESVRLCDKEKNYPSQLSGGQQQRVAIARALANCPEIILADEPTGNLDKKNAEEIMNILNDLNELGATLVVITHDEVVANYAKRKIILDDGSVISDTLIGSD